MGGSDFRMVMGNFVLTSIGAVSIIVLTSIAAVSIIVLTSIGAVSIIVLTSIAQSEIYRRGNVEDGWKSLIMVDHAWKCQ